MASRFHLSLGGKPPISHRVIALNSFVLPAQEVDVSSAPLLGLCPYGLIKPDYPARLVNELSMIQIDLCFCYAATGRSSGLLISFISFCES